MTFQNDEHLNPKTREANPTTALTKPKTHPNPKNSAKNLTTPTCICCNLHQKKTLNMFFSAQISNIAYFWVMFHSQPPSLQQNTPPERLRLRRPPQGKAKPSHQPQEKKIIWGTKKTSYFPLYQLVNDGNIMFPTANKLNKGFAAEESDLFFEIFGWAFDLRGILIS